jgi:hypothetical protein
MSARRITHVARLGEGWVKDGTPPALVVLVAWEMSDTISTVQERYGRW